MKRKSKHFCQRDKIKHPEVYAAASLFSKYVLQSVESLHEK